MSMLFINSSNDEIIFEINNRGWRRIFRLALMFGWEPHGTQYNTSSLEIMDWDQNNYFTNDGQVVTQDDAIELANAIDQAITKLEEEDPDDNPEKFGNDWENEMALRCDYALRIGLKNPGYIFFDISWSKKLTEFVEFCRQGEFTIY